MLVIVGLIDLLVVAIVTIVGVPSNAGAAHPLTDFSVFGYHLTGVDRHVVPLRDRGRRGGVARPCDRRPRSGDTSSFR
jgi:hypothetical protein